MYHSFKGWDIFYADPDQCTTLNCRVCGTACTVKRGVYGPTGMCESMGEGGHLHDEFKCPHSGMEWHNRALKLAMAIEDMPSPSVATMMIADLNQLVKNHLAR